MESADEIIRKKLASGEFEPNPNNPNDLSIMTFWIWTKASMQQDQVRKRIETIQRSQQLNEEQYGKAAGVAPFASLAAEIVPTAVPKVSVNRNVAQIATAQNAFQAKAAADPIPPALLQQAHALVPAQESATAGLAAPPPCPKGRAKHIEVPSKAAPPPAPTAKAKAKAKAKQGRTR